MTTPKTDSIMNFSQVIGSPGTFETGMDITIFESKLTNFFMANSIENKIQKRAILLSSVSEEIHKVLFSLCVPSTPNDVEYDTLIKSLNKYFKPVKSYFAARYTFYQARQRQDESVCQWGARVKNLASKCGFSSELTTVIRDIFVVGMGSGPIQDRLLEEDAANVGVTYSKLMEIATAKEAAINDKSSWNKEERVDLKYQKKSNGHSQAKQGFHSKIKCGVCGRSNHLQKDCRYKDYECNNCGEKGHLSTVCKKETMIIRSIFFAAFVFYFSNSSATKICDRKPTTISTPKSTNPHPFRIIFKGNVEFYTPGTTYTVLLQGIKTIPTATPSFTSFILMVEAEESQNYDDENNDFITGKFQLTGDVRTKISEVCPNTVTQTSLIPKSEVQVFWTAPLSGSGCVIFRATIVEYRDIWYMDDDQLNKRICEESNESNDDNANVVYECCACHEAKFELTFEGLWSRHTHPKDYPDDNWQTRFSDVIGASHTIDYRFWEQDQVASDGMNSIAQSGTTSTLESELKSKSDKIRTIIKARGISYPNVTGKTFAVFRVDQDHHLISVVSFMYPSPDWFVGISGLELCLPNCNWITNKTINLYPWDAGIDSGVTYNSSDMPQVPIMNIERVWPSNTNDVRSPFYDQSGAQMKPIAKLHLMRQRLYEKSCSEEEPKTESTVCDTGPWSDWDECSVTCGKGYSNRYRQYKNPEDAHKPHCSKRSMSQRKGCYVLPSCAIESEETDTIDPKCDVTAFGQWSDCSAECGPGVTARFRTILNEEVTPKYCLGRMFLQQTMQCESKPCQDERDNVDLGIICSNCSLTKWSLWSPCNMKCGTGQKERHRMNLDRSGVTENCDSRCYTQTINCTDNPPCENNMRMETTISPSSENTPVTSVTINPDDISEDSTEKCFLSNWSKFSSCNAICGPGFKERTRTILSPTDPLEQKKCRKKLVDRRNCRGRQCSRCNYSPWSEWSLCSALCGMNAVQQRTRVPENVTWTWCKDRLEQRICSALACKTD